MIKTTTWWIAFTSAFFATTLANAATELPVSSAAPPKFVWQQSLPVRSRDPRIAPIGGTEIRALVGFDEKLFASNGYWMDAETKNPALPGAQIFRLDSADSEWQVDLELKERAPSGLRLYQAISILEKVRFTTASDGLKLASPVEFLIAGAWKRGAGLEVFARGSGSKSGSWSTTSLAGKLPMPQGTQIRAFSLHQDRVTGVDVVFAGASKAIFVGKYNRDREAIDWSNQPEWQAPDAGDPSRAKGRVASFAECNGRLFAAAYDTIYERTDGLQPTWHKVYEAKINAQSDHVTGFRGLTSVTAPSGSGEVLLVTVEDSPSRIYRIDPHADEKGKMYPGTLDLNVSTFLSHALGVKITYAIVAYNNMTIYPANAESGPRLLIGVQPTTQLSNEPFGDHRHRADAHFLIRDAAGNYELQEISDPHIEPKPMMVSVRTLVNSPFPSAVPGTIYAGGFDTNNVPVHNTAWLYQGVPAAKAFTPGK